MGDNQDFHACANSKGIEYMNGLIYDGVGITGTWYCDNAVSLALVWAIGVSGLAVI